MGDSRRLGRRSVVARLTAETVLPADLPIPGAEGPPAPEGEKYSVEGPIGSGGMGEVVLVRDRDLRRQVAMKMMKPAAAAHPRNRMRFVAEAQTTSQLEHPGIPPIHDLGITADGVPYFTMKLVRGRTLREVLHDLFLGRKEVRRDWSLHRLVTGLERICEAVHFAHELGVVHRDLKPENIMLGDYGEVHVVDWGIARVDQTGVDTEERVSSAREDAGDATLDGVVKGTLPYMSPEQATPGGPSLDRRSDVYSLGCILYEMLTLQQAFEGDRVLERVREGTFPPVRARNPRRPVPEDLAALCERAMAKEREARPPSARALGEALRSWLDGTSERDRRHREAEGLAARGAEAAARHREIRDRIRAAEDEADAAAGRFRPWQAVAEKRPLLEARRRAAALDVEVVLARTEAMKFLEAALVAEEGHAGARAVLADLWRERLVDAEQGGDAREAAQALRMLERFDDGRLAGVVRGDGSLYLGSEPAGADVVLHRLEEADGVLVPDEGRPLGRTPVGPLPLPMGSYLCILRKQGFREARYPVHVTRNRSWSGGVVMRTEEAIGGEFAFVPGGPFLLGQGRTAGRAEVADFAIQRMPVTFADYGEFLDALEKEQGSESAAKRVPGTAGDGPFMARTGEGRWAPIADFVEGKARERCLRDHGPEFHRRVPVLGVSHEDAAAYCAWKTRATGREWRLPTEEEREKAARGVDGRLFPWGDLEDASLGKCRDSRDEPAQPEPAGAFPAATSIYGMVDAAGGAFEWTDSWLDGRGTLRVLKGGAWNGSVALLRCPGRIGHAPGLRLAVTGFRCARGFG